MNPQEENLGGRDAAAARRKELKRLQESGTLLANELAPRMSAELREACRETWTSKPGTEAVLLLWNSFDTSRTGKGCRWRQFAPPNWAPEEVPFPSGLDTHLIQFSPSGRLLATREGWHELRLRIWDVATGRKLAENKLGRGFHPIPSLCFNADESRLYITLSSPGVILSLSTGLEAEPMQEIKFDAPTAFNVLTSHPQGGWLAAELGGRLGLLELGPPVRLRELSIGGEWDIGGTFLREVSKSEFQRKLTELKQQHPAQEAYLENVLMLQKQMAGRARPEPRERVMALAFTPDGRWLICGTSEGVRVFDWARLIKIGAGPVQWDYSAEAEEPAFWLDKWASKAIHCVSFDILRQRVLFSGEEGKLKYLELGTRRTGDLLAGPERTPITRFSLSDQRSIIAMTRVQGGHGNDKRAKFQIWSYPALCAAAGLEF